jgi:hypothetical protein
LTQNIYALNQHKATKLENNIVRESNQGENLTQTLWIVSKLTLAMVAMQAKVKLIDRLHDSVREEEIALTGAR